MKKLFFGLFVLLLFFGCAQQQLPQQPLSGQQGQPIENPSVSFTVVADGQTMLEKTAQVENGTSALDALKQVTEVEVQEFEFGSFVTSIAGIDAGQSSYWAFYVDGQYAEKGLSDYLIEKDTQIRLELEKIE